MNPHSPGFHPQRAEMAGRRALLVHWTDPAVCAEIARMNVCQLRSLLAALLVGISSAVVATAAEPAPAKVSVIAHRGDHTQAHENSLAAIGNAIQAGVDCVEIDVRRTRDGEYVLLHDSTVDRTTDGRGKLAGLTWDQVHALSLTNRQRPELPPARVPTLDEALKAMRGRIGLYLDFKDGDRAVVARKLREQGMIEATVVYDDLEQMAEWRRLEPKLRLIASPRDRDRGLDALRSLKASVPVDILDGPVTAYTPARVADAKLAGFLVWPDIQDSAEGPAAWGAAIEMGVQGLMSDRPGELVVFLRARGLHP